MGITDFFNRLKNPPKQTDLEVEQAGPGEGSVRTIQTTTRRGNLTPERIGQILRDAENGDATGYLELAEELEEKDLHYAAVLAVRKRAIRALNLEVTAGGDTDADEEAAQFVRDQLNSYAVRCALTDIMDAIGKGFSVHEIMWNFNSEEWTIGRLKYRDPTWFQFDRIDGETLYVRDAAGDLEMTPGRFVTHMAKAKSGTPIRSGVARIALWAYMFKNFAIKDWAIFLEAFGHPVRIGRYGPNATTEDKRTLLRALRMIGTNMAAAIPKSMEIELQNGNVTGGADMFERSARYWDEQMSKLILGQVSTTDAIAGGHAVGKVQNEVREDIRDADAEELAASIGLFLVQPLALWNFGPDVAMPSISFVSEEQHDKRLIMMAIKEFLPRGMNVGVGFVRKTFGIREPAEGEELLVEAPKGEPTSSKTRDLMASAASRFEETGDSLDGLLAATLQSYSAAQSDPMISGIMEALAGAETVEEMRDILDQLISSAPDATFREFMQNVMFSARLAGETNAEVT